MNAGLSKCLLPFFLLALGGCAAEEDGTETPAPDDKTTPATSPSNSWADPPASTTPPSNPSTPSTPTTPPATEPPPDPTNPPSPTPTTTNNPPSPPPPSPMKATCTATKTDGDKVLRSDTTITYLKSADGKSLTIQKYEILVANGFNNDENDVDVYLVSGTTETKLFNTGNVLKNNTRVSIDGANRKLLITQKIKMSTNFDKSFAPDPYAQCEVTFK